LAPVRMRDLIGLPDHSPLWNFQPDGQFFLIDQARFPPEWLARLEAVSALVFRIDQSKDPEQVIALADELLQLITRRPELAEVAKTLADMVWYAMVTLTGEHTARKTFPKNLMEMRSMLQENLKVWRDKQQQEWLQTGEQTGEKKGEAKMLIRQLQHRFGQVPEQITARIKQADLKLLETWIDNFVFAQSLDDVFAN